MRHLLSASAIELLTDRTATDNNVKEKAEKKSKEKFKAQVEAKFSAPTKAKPKF